MNSMAMSRFLSETLLLRCREVAFKVAVAVAQEAIQSGSAVSEEGQGSKVDLKNMERHLQDLQYDPFKAPYWCSRSGVTNSNLIEP